MQFALPTIGEGLYEAELVRWLVTPGETVRPGQPLLEVMTDKATMEVPAPFAGTISALKAEAGGVIRVGQHLLDYTSSGAGQGSGTEGVSTGETASVTTRAARNGLQAGQDRALIPEPTPLTVRAAPSVRQMARKLGIDLTTVPGSGPQGRILIEDLTGRMKPAAKPEPAVRIESGMETGKPGTRIPLRGMRRRIAERMVQAKRTIPHYSYIDECEVSELVRLRASLKDLYLESGVKLTYLAFFVKAVALALQVVPIVNASLDEEKEEIVLHDRYDVGIAVATPGGLLVPVIRDANRKDLGQIAREIDRLSSEARMGKSRREDLRGGTFTVTSVGNIGGLISTPVVNHPEVGILGIGKVVRRPVYDDSGVIRPADLVYLSFSFDHRVVDGAVGATFGNAVSKELRNPARLLMVGRV